MKQLAHICVFLTAVIPLVISASARESALPHPCDSQIYCYGPLLHTVQMAELYNDSKYFVDMTLVHYPNVTLSNFKTLMELTDGEPTKQEIQEFVDEHFRDPGAEFAPWDPDDWQPNPSFLDGIVDPDLQKWANELHILWKELGRKISEDVKNTPEKYSQIYVSNPVIVPGGRFREFYYWDSFWTMEGLLLSGMTTTVKGMLVNFVDMIKKYGMVPNGGRVYYTRRSQPPYLIPMFKLYLDHTQDYEFVKQNIKFLEAEFKYWMDNRMVHMRDKESKVHKVFQYNVQVGDPRPEAYKEDYEVAQNETTTKAKDDLYVEFKSGAESGWDYSTRWFVVGDSNKGDLSDLNVTSIAPVDLNSLLCYNAKLLSEFFVLANETSKANVYTEFVASLNETIAEVFWDEEDGIWYDVNIHTGNKRKFFYLSNVHPIWGGCFGYEGSKQSTLTKVIDYLKRKNVIDFIGGVPTSLKDSGEQWDFPNAWAPLQHIAIMGLYGSQSLNEDAEPLAFELAEKWVRTNYEGYRQTNSMFEKYDVNVVGVPGGGGEYNVQVGFGWSNGVAMKLMDLYGDRLTTTTGGSEKGPEVFTLLVLLSTAASLVMNLGITIKP